MRVSVCDNFGAWLVVFGAKGVGFRDQGRARHRGLGIRQFFSKTSTWNAWYKAFNPGSVQKRLTNTGVGFRV